MEQSIARVAIEAFDKLEMVSGKKVIYNRVTLSLKFAHWPVFSPLHGASAKTS